MKTQTFQPRLPGSWWLRRANYRRYMLRELSSLPIALYAIVLILGLRALSQGADAWAAFRSELATPFALALQLVVLVFAVIHSVSWFALAPRTLPVYIGARRLADSWISAAHYLVWVAVSILIVLAVGG